MLEHRQRLLRTAVIGEQPAHAAIERDLRVVVGGARIAIDQCARDVRVRECLGELRQQISGHVDLADPTVGHDPAETRCFACRDRVKQRGRGRSAVAGAHLVGAE